MTTRNAPIQPVILSGGAGTRLWPLSRKHFPKQLLPLTGELTLLQETARRLVDFSGSAVREPILVCNEAQRFMVAEQLKRVEAPKARILLEPVGRNTAPALTLAALDARQVADPLLLVMPADHLIPDPQAFHAAIEAGTELAREGNVITFGVVPTTAETGYGYIRRDGTGEGPSRAAKFVEKPDRATAQTYVDDGRYVWNSGIFLLRASVWLELLETHAPEMAAACMRAYEAGESDEPFYRISREAFASCPSDSIDYAVMERIAGEAGRLYVVPLAAGWSDVGGWRSLWEVLPKDDGGNVRRGDVYTHDARNSLLMAGQRCVAAVGVDNLIVVETADAVLVAHRDRAQDVKHIVEQMREDMREECEQHRRVFRPWGDYEGLDKGERFQVKRIVVKPGEALSLQMHHHRAEHWVVVRGTAKVTRGDETFIISENQSTYIPLGVKHRLENPGTIPLEIIEVQSGSYLGEDDIVRFDDVYGRGADAPPPKPAAQPSAERLVGGALWGGGRS
ncbi:mannose-1-phosphate guanylyltransferase/mannose-6-phosphate isomerase [Ectothiorhodospiraceae bacterium 2226]|nr:mannose-1-phosphate guanylyltransferase/mannose-6-phosphate isomerase [Ectothiorhodospiraceae bacterium 2226]